MRFETKWTPRRRFTASWHGFQGDTMTSSIAPLTVHTRYHIFYCRIYSGIIYAYISYICIYSYIVGTSVVRSTDAQERRKLHLRELLEFMASLATAEACDSNIALIASGDLRALQPVFQIYGQCRAFSGPIVTLKVFEDNVLVRQMLETRGEGRVLVIDGGGSMRCALVGGNLGQLAQNMGWSGIVVNGCIRDVDEINSCDIGVRALASHPQKSSKKGNGEMHVPIHIGGTLIRDGEWLYADSDGILVSKTELSV